MQQLHATGSRVEVRTVLKPFRRTMVACLTSMFLTSPAFASFHLMKVEQVIGGVGGDATQQAIQLRMRAGGQNLVGNIARLVVRDAAGQNPVTIITFSSNVASGNLGDRILVVSPAFAAAHPNVGDFTMTSLIPSSYLAAGRLTYEDTGGNIYWSLAWGGAGYTGSNTGLITNDADGNFGPPFGAALPSGSSQALLFSTADTNGSAPSVSNSTDYAITGGGATFRDNQGRTVTLTSQADLSISKTDMQATATPGQPVTYTIVASNAGPSAVIGATVADTLPAAITGATWTCVGAGGGSCTASGSGDINDLVNLPLGATATYTLTGTISALAMGSLSNTATVTAPGAIADPNPANNSATDTDTLVTGTSSVNVTISPANTVIFRQFVTYTATVTPMIATGMVTFMDGGTPVGSGVLDASGQATLNTDQLTIGRHVITAVYSGDATYGGSSSTAMIYYRSPRPH
jgi:uncharacterized repeat protein (TIGR01451 family)